MFSNKKPTEQKSQTPSVLSSDVNILGNILSDGYMDIDGTVEGNVKCSSITIRQNGRIKGDVIAENVQVYGEVHGLIKGRIVNLFKSCRVEGIIMHESLSIEDGAFVDGQFKRTDKVFLDTKDEDMSDKSLFEGIETESDNIRLLAAKG